MHLRQGSNHNFWKSEHNRKQTDPLQPTHERKAVDSAMKENNWPENSEKHLQNLSKIKIIGIWWNTWTISPALGKKPNRNLDLEKNSIRKIAGWAEREKTRAGSLRGGNHLQKWLKPISFACASKFEPTFSRSGLKDWKLIKSLQLKELTFKKCSIKPFWKNLEGISRGKAFWISEWLRHHFQRTKQSLQKVLLYFNQFE